MQFAVTYSGSINCIGLVLDIIGVVVLFKYGLPADVSPGGIIGLALEQTDKKEAERFIQYQWRSRLGLTAILAGFAIQLISNFVTN
jgi:hypothetical protein